MGDESLTVQKETTGNARIAPENRLSSGTRYHTSEAERVRSSLAERHPAQERQLQEVAQIPCIAIVHAAVSRVFAGRQVPLRTPRHPGNPVQPQSGFPLLAPRRATRLTIVAAHRGHVGGLAAARAFGTVAFAGTTERRKSVSARPSTSRMLWSRAKRAASMRERSRRDDDAAGCTASGHRPEKLADDGKADAARLPVLVLDEARRRTHDDGRLPSGW